MSNLLVLCPFHPERVGRDDGNPSLNLDFDQEVYFCHGCGARGRISQHPELYELAENHEIPRYVPQKEIVIPDLAGAPLDYLKRRGFDEQVLKQFGVGGNQDRIWIPVTLMSGRNVGTITRFLPEFGDNRYMYSYGFEKRNYLFGTSCFKYCDDTVVVVEGSLDCIRMHQIGITNTIAILGNRATSSQISLLKLLGTRVVLALDNDDAGIQGAKALGRVLQVAGHEVYKLDYDAKDPGELVTPESIKTRPFVHFMLDFVGIETSLKIN